MSTELLEMSALEQARLIARKKISCEELTELYLDRIDRLDPELHAFVDVYRREALFNARLKDLSVRRGGPLPPFHGVPIGIKDLNLVRGRRARFGSQGMIPFWSPVDDASVACLRRAGFVILGKLATPELGALPITEPVIHSPTRNPWNLELTPGGSSGGSAVAVAARLLPVAHGTDGGGSIRIPSAFNGLVGLKAGRGRIRNAYGLPDQRILYTSGALTRTVSDAAAMLDVMSGITEGKPHWAALPPEPFAVAAERQPKPLRIRMSFESYLVRTDSEVRDAVASVARQLEALGHHVEEDPGPEARVEEFVPLWGLTMATMPLMRWERAEPVTRWLRKEGKSRAPDEITKLHSELESRLLGWFEGTDLWLSPTVAILPPKIGSYPQDESQPSAAFYKAAELGAFTALANVTGQPAISIPAGLSKSGLPIGAQLTGPLQGEAMLLRVGRQLEQARPWAQWLPKGVG
jgi:amidase